ncbi:MAG: response regulator transcription factor [Candidatus Solibacter sp.]|jgi:DNA-binding NarL/FixJ family response regulator
MRQEPKLSILIVDDHLLIRLGLKQVLGQEFRNVVFGEAETAELALAQIKAQPWRLVILDVSLPDDDRGFSVLREVCARRPEAAVLVLGMHPDSQYAARSLQLGASGYVSKNSGRSDLLKAVGDILDGKKHFSESVRREAHSQRSAARHADLSAQEYKVLLALAAGRPAAEVASELNVSAKTVSTYKSRILNKLCLQSTAGLVRYVIEHKLS